MKSGMKSKSGSSDSSMRDLSSVHHAGLAQLHRPRQIRAERLSFASDLGRRRAARQRGNEEMREKKSRRSCWRPNCWSSGGGAVPIPTGSRRFRPRAASTWPPGDARRGDIHAGAAILVVLCALSGTSRSSTGCCSRASTCVVSSLRTICWELAGPCPGGCYAIVTTRLCRHRLLLEAS